MKKVIRFLLAIVLAGNFAAHAQNKKKSDNNLKLKTMKILFVLTSHDQLGNTGEKTGFWIEEFATPYYFFEDKGIEVTIASPKGGQPPIDPKSNLPDYSTPATKRFYADKAAQEKLSKTLKLSEVNQKN
jgi:putative intracellular protease/amidase